MDMNYYLGTDETEKPLDNLVSDGGFASIFRTVACVGDSLASGEFESVDDEGKHHYHDCFEYSWGQYFARASGSTVYNFSRGGMTAKEYVETFADKMDFWNKDFASKAYIIALGVNESGRGVNIGSKEDINLSDYSYNADSFYGNYGKIIQKYKEIMPDAKFFFMTIPLYGNERDKAKKDLNCAIREMAEIFGNSYLLDLEKYSDLYNEKTRETFFRGGHMTAAGYYFSYKVITSYIDYIVRHNPEDFAEVGFIGTEFCYDR